MRMSKTSQQRSVPTDVWARQWLYETDRARRAIEVARRAARSKRSRLGSIADPLASQPHGKGGVSDPMRRVDDVLDAEAELGGGVGSPLRWAFDQLREFDAAMARMRDGCQFEVFEGTYAAELRYRLGLPPRQAAEDLGCSESTLRSRIDALVGYMDMLGYARVVRGA